MLDFQGNMVLCANQIWWTAEVEDVFVRISHGQMEAMKNVSHFVFIYILFIILLYIYKIIYYYIYIYLFLILPFINIVFTVFEAIEQSVERGGDVDGRRHVDEQRQEKIRHGVDDRRTHERHRGRFREGQHHRSVRVRMGESVTVRSIYSFRLLRFSANRIDKATFSFLFFFFFVKVLLDSKPGQRLGAPMHGRVRIRLRVYGIERETRGHAFDG